MIDPGLGYRFEAIHKRFLELLASGRYYDAKVWLNGIRVRATAERDDPLYFFASLLVGICLQQEGDTRRAGRILREVIKGTRNQFVRLSARIHLSKVYSQSGRFDKASKALRQALESISRFNFDLDQDLRDQLRLPILWRLGLAEKLTGSPSAGQRDLDEHFELSTVSPYQRANALAVRAILFAAGEKKQRFSDIADNLREASAAYSRSSMDTLNSFAFKSKAELGMDLLDAVLDFQSGRRVSSYKKLYIVRYHAQRRGILPSSEGFAEMINPSLELMPALKDMLLVPEAEYERWMFSQADWEALQEGRLLAHDLFDSTSLTIDIHRVREATDEELKPRQEVTPEMYERIIGIIRDAGRAIEITPATYRTLKEEELRNLLLVSLNSHFKGAVTGEAFRAKGKTDILVEGSSRSAFVAECKIWHGGSELLKACDQLLGYLTWRDSMAALIIFNKNVGEFSQLLADVPTVFGTHPGFVKQSDVDERGEWRFELLLPDDPGKTVRVHVLLFNLFAKK